MKLRHRKKRLRQFVKGGTTRLINPEIAQAQEALKAASNGVLRQETRELQLPDALVEASDTSPTRILPGPFMTTIIILALILITVIAWLVSRMPE